MLTKARGFTLIELMVALTLFGTLLALGFPSFTTWIRNSQVRTVADAALNGMRMAQAEAVRRNQQVVLSFTNDANPTLNPTAVAGGRKWSVQTVASPYINGNAADFIGSGVLSDVASGVTINAVDNGGTSVLAVCFNANGRLMAPTGAAATANCSTNPVTIQFAQAGSDRPLNVTVAIGGQVRMCDPNRPSLSSTSPDGC
jgi:type IV fimbrial biogenesis protein FimT